ncbi:MAG TPA: hypothetical protein PK490_05445 [Prosthecobacter sp.]|nr:hypothetical protein [Prosthecobacter sp.]HRK13709.1 hypothetical protein [Prosthecobacter sp.]
MNTRFLGLLALVWVPGVLQAAVRSSTAYSTSIEALDAGGGTASSAGYTQSVTSIGLIGWVQTSADYNSQTGYVPQTSSAAIGPTGGTMVLAPASPLDASAALTVTFSGWHDDDPPLSYAVLINNVVVSPQGNSALRNFTGPGAPGAYTLKGRIYDALGGFTEVAQDFTVNTAQQSWRQQYFGTTANSGDAADGFDFDEDGLVNLLEWAAGLNPTLASTLTTTAARSGELIEFHYTRSLTAAAAGAVFIVEWSDTLAANDWHTAGVTQQPLGDNGTLQQMQATLPAGSLGRRFVRLRVTAPPP